MATYASKGDRFERNTIHANAIKRVYGTNSGAGLSDFWNDCPAISPLVDPFMGYGISDDFVMFPPNSVTTAATLGYNGMIAFNSSGGTVAGNDALNGEVVLTEATDNEGNSLTYEQHPFRITSGAGSLWFEARIKTSTVTASKQGFFVGLTDTTAPTATVPLAADGTLADLNLVGFYKPEGNTTTFNTSYRADGVAAVNVQTGVGTLAADTYIKLGMKFDTITNYLTFYVNGTPQTGTKLIPNATGTDFPADIGLAPQISQLLAATASYTLTIDWWKCYQARV